MHLLTMLVSRNARSHPGDQRKATGAIETPTRWPIRRSIEAQPGDRLLPCVLHRAGAASAWRLPRHASNWSCSNVNSRGLVYAILTEHFGSPSAVCGPDGQMP